MVSVLAGRVHDARLDPHAVHGMFRLRNDVFHERLGWNVASRGGIERDTYDDLDPVYLIARGPGRAVTGCMRLLPTTGPYMLRDTFPELLAGEPGPDDPRVWDISRFAVSPRAHGTDAPPGASCSVAVELVRTLFDYCLDEGIDAGVAVVSVGLERILRRLGLPMQRFGDGRSRWVGDVRAVACWIHMTGDARRNLQRVARRAA